MICADLLTPVKTTENCYLPEYDLILYGDCKLPFPPAFLLASSHITPTSLTSPSRVVRADLEYCGEVPLDITRQDATVRYLSECKWSRATSSESIVYYGRDVDVTLTCWANGNTIMGDP